jgi:hypothetical protein
LNIGTTYYICFFQPNIPQYIDITLNSNYSGSLWSCSSPILNQNILGIPFTMSTINPNFNNTFLNNVFNSPSTVGNSIFDCSLSSFNLGQISNITFDVINPFYDPNNTQSLTFSLPQFGFFINGVLIYTMGCQSPKANAARITFATAFSNMISTNSNIQIKVLNNNNRPTSIYYRIQLLNNTYLSITSTCNESLEFQTLETNPTNDLNLGGSLNAEIDANQNGNYTILNNTDVLFNYTQMASQYGINQTGVGGSVQFINIENPICFNSIKTRKTTIQPNVALGVLSSLHFTYNFASNINNLQNNICSSPNYNLIFSTRRNPLISVNGNSPFNTQNINTTSNSIVNLTGTHATVFSWRYTNNEISTESQINIIKDCEAITQYRLVNEFNCMAYANLVSTPVLSNQTIVQNTNISAPNLTLQHNSGLGTYLWNTGATSNPLSICSNGNYSCTFTNSAGCSRTSNITVSNLPSYAITQLENSLIVPSGFANYLWSTGETTSEISILESGVYSVEITTSSGCVFSLTINATFNPCYGGLIFTNNEILPSNFSNSTLNISGTVFINQDANYLGCEFIMQPGSKITIINNAKVITDNCHFFSCENVMWKGIEVAEGALLEMKNNCLLEQAEIGVLVNVINPYSNNRCTADYFRYHHYGFVANNCSFDKNYIHTKIVTPEPYLFNHQNSDDISSWYWGPVVNCNFNCTGLLPQPYDGQTTELGEKTYAGIVFGNVYCYNCLEGYDGSTDGCSSNFTQLDFVLGANTFQNLNFGVISQNGSLLINNQTFSNINPENLYEQIDRNSGAAIYQNNYIEPSLLNGASSVLMVANNNFSDCKYGIVSGGRTGSFIRNNSFNAITKVAISLSSHLYSFVFANTIQSKYLGIVVSNSLNLNFAKTAIKSNNISILPDAAPYATGIWVQGMNNNFGGSYSSNDNFISSNTINMNSANYSAAISATGCKFLKIGAALSNSNTNSSMFSIGAANTINLNNSNNAIAYGIRTTNCTNLLIKGNNVLGNSSSMANKRAISLSLCNSPIVSCNITNNTEVGLNFSNNNANADIKANEFYTHNKALLYDYSAITGQQNNKGNKWLGNYSVGSGNYGAYYSANGNQNIFNQSRYFNSPQSIYFPSTIFPIQWFVSFQGNEASCQSTNIPYNNLITQNDLVAAQTYFGNIDYEQLTNYAYVAALLDKLKEFPALKENNTVLESFYQENENTNLDKLSTSRIIENNLSVDTKIKILEIEALNEQLKTDLENNSNPIGEEEQITTWLKDFNQKYESIGPEVLSAVIEAYQLNQTIYSFKEFENNEKYIYLLKQGKCINSSIIGEAEISSLLEIANQCPYEGGSAVFEARGILQGLGIDSDFNDAEICNAVGVYARIANTQDTISFDTESSRQLLLNSNQDIQIFTSNKRVYLHNGLPTAAKLTVKDIAGKSIFTSTIAQSINTYDLSNFADGIYFVEVFNSSNERIKNIKLVLSN